MKIYIVNGYSEEEILDALFKERFATVKAQRDEAVVADIDDFKNLKYFQTLMGYINTDPSKQKKGVGGHAK